MACVYLHRKKSDLSIYYVGIGLNKSRSREIRGRNTHWQRVYKKYGRIIDVIAEDIDLDDAKDLEMLIISEIGLSNLCNQTLGGEGFFGGKHSDESKRKMSKALKGRKLSKEHREKLSKARQGFKWSKSAKIKMSESAKKREVQSFSGKSHSEKTKKIIANKHKINNHKPTRQALNNATRTRRNKGVKIKDLNTGFEFMGWECEKYYKVPKRTIYDNSLTDKPIERGKHKGQNFKRI